jgi:hypothetical protein
MTEIAGTLPFASLRVRGADPSTALRAGCGVRLYIKPLHEFDGFPAIGNSI